MPTHDIIVIGGSAGALVSLRKILQDLPSDFPAAIFVVVHTSPESPSMLPHLLTRAGRLRAEAAVDGASFTAGRIYVAPPDHHLLLELGRVRVTRGPRENRVRPAVDPLFRTAAAAYGPRVVGIILSGGQDDGVAGLSHIKRAGGIAIVQDPSEAEATGMPESAIREIDVDHVLRTEDMVAVISGLVHMPIGESGTRGNAGPLDVVEAGRDTAESGSDALHSGVLPGPPSPFTCPECGGALWEMRDGELIRFRCHVGHAFNGNSLVAAQSGTLESALWTALRALEESSALRRRMADHARRRGMGAIAEAYEEQARESELRAEVVRGALVDAPVRRHLEVPSATEK
jgi:two-component system chemotaxis response regulator CheB